MAMEVKKSVSATMTVTEDEIGDAPRGDSVEIRARGEEAIPLLHERVCMQRERERPTVCVHCIVMRTLCRASGVT